MKAIRFNLLMAFILFSVCISFAQSINERMSSIDVNNFYEIDSIMKLYIKETGDQRMAKHWGRYESQMKGMVYPSGNIYEAEEKEIQSYLKFQRNQQSSRSTHAAWSLYGPTSTYDDQYGRCLRIKPDPSDSNILYVVASGSGLWRSPDQGITWEDLTPNLPNLFITDVEIDQNDSKILYILTGDGESAFFGKRSTYGVLKSVDGGQTWLPTSFFNPSYSNFPHKLIMYPGDSDIMMAAMNNKILRTDDGWKTSKVVMSGENFFDIEWIKDGGAKAFAVSDKLLRMSIDTGKTWTQVVDIDFKGSNGKNKRRAIATSSSDFNKLYMVVANDTMTWVFRSDGGGLSNTWTLQDSTTHLIGGQSFYNMCITISPFNPDIIFVGGIGIFRSLNKGLPGSWVDKHSIHFDHHDVRFIGGILYDLNDGGIAKSADGEIWYNITPGILVSENYRIDGTPMNTSLYLCGNQDVGLFKVNGGTFNYANLDWGDIMEVIIDYNNPDNMFASPQLGGLRSSTDGGLTWADPTWEPGGNTEWITPYHMDTGNPKYIFMGRDSIYRMDFATSTSVLLGDGINGNTREIKQGYENRNRLYAISGNNLFRTDDALGAGLATWTDITNEIPNEEAWLERIAVNPANYNEIYVVCSNYSAGNKVFFSNQGGDTTSWQNITYGLPNVRIKSIAFHYDGENNHKVYIGTEIGVFYINDNLTDWVYFSNGMPNVPVNDLYINTADHKIMAATWGRGMWQASLYSDCPNSITLTGSAPDDGTLYYSANTDIWSINAYSKSLGTNIHYQAGDYVDMELGFELFSPGTFEVDIGPCPEYVHPDFKAAEKESPNNFSQLVISEEIFQKIIEKEKVPSQIEE